MAITINFISTVNASVLADMKICLRKSEQKGAKLEVKEPLENIQLHKIISECNIVFLAPRLSFFILLFLNFLVC